MKISCLHKQIFKFCFKILVRLATFALKICGIKIKTVETALKSSLKYSVHYSHNIKYIKN